MMPQVKDIRARYNANGSAIIPNTFQHPNVFVDRLMYYLTPNENVVLVFATRRIIGFVDNIISRKDNISLSQFTDGIENSRGEIVSRGCGLSADAVRTALDGLEKFKVLLPTTEKPDPKRGQEYWLQDDENNIDWAGLEERKAEKAQIQYKRTQKARCSVGQDTPVGQNPKGNVGQNPSLLSDRNTKPTETKKTQYGADAPQTPKMQDEELPMDWRVGLGMELKNATPEELFKKEARDSANLIDQGCAGAGELAYAFMVTRNIIIHESKAKGQRKAAKEMLEMHVKATHVIKATKQLMEARDKRGNPLTVIDLFSVADTAISIANEPKGNISEPKVTRGEQTIRYSETGGIISY